MKIKLSNLIQLTISLVLAGGLVYWFIHQMTPEQKQGTIDSFKRANYLWLLLTLLLGLLSSAFRAQRWRLMFRPIGYNPGYLNTFFSVNVMFFANLFIPRLGEVSRCSILAKYEDVPVEQSIGTMVAERFIDLICMMGLLGLLLLMERELIASLLESTFSNPSKTSMHWSLKYGIPVAILLGLVIISYISYRKYGYLHLKNSIIKRIKGLFGGVISILKMKDLGQFIVLSLGIWISYILMTYIAFQSLPETSSLGLLPATACLIFGGFAMVATPGGIGTYPIAVMGVLTLYGINEVIGGAFGTLAWGAQTVGVFIAGVTSLLLLALMNPKKKSGN